MQKTCRLEKMKKCVIFIDSILYGSIYYSEVLHEEDDPIDNRLLCIAPHRSAAFSKSRESISEPSILILKRQFSVLRNSVLVLFMAEKARSHAAILTGTMAAMVANLVSSGYISVRLESVIAVIIWVMF